MKQAILFAVFLFFSSALYAQGTFNNTGSGLNDMNRYMNDKDGDEELEDDEERSAAGGFEGISMKDSDELVSFDNLPAKTSITAHITNANGDVLIQRSISNEKNSIKIDKLPKGLFFITLTFNDQRKAFTLDRSEGERGSKK